MPLNSTQRPIFVYLRSKNDHKSCTPAGAKLTNEDTHRTNKNNPCTISVTPSQLCTFFRKRTVTAPPMQNFLGGDISFFTEEEKNSSDLSFDSSEVSFDSSEEISLTSLENFYFPRSYWKFSTWRCRSNGRISEQCGELYGRIVVHLCIKEEPATKHRDRLLSFRY